MKRFAAYFKPNRRYREIMYLMGLLVCSNTMADIEIIFKETAILFLSRDKVDATKVWEALDAKIRQRGIEKNEELLNESSHDDENDMSEDIAESDNSFVRHFAEIEGQIIKEIAKDEDKIITYVFYIPKAWKKCMCMYV